MGKCWSCYWGWPKPVAEIYQKALERLNGDDAPLHSAFGPSHLVWADENFDFAEDCLEDFDENKGNCTEDELEIVRQSLEELAKLPLEVRCVEPDNYDGEHPKLFPPPDGVEMVRI